MSDLVFIAFDSEQKAEAVREKVLGMQKEYLIELGDAVVAVKDANGRIKLNQLMNTTAQGAMTGALWGALIGLIFLNPLIGMGIGAASGALSGKLVDVGINDQFMTDAASALRPGGPPPKRRPPRPPEQAANISVARGGDNDMMLKWLAGLGLCAMLAVLAPLSAPAQSNQSGAAASAASMPNRATVRSGTHRTRVHHRSTLNRQKARATAEHSSRLQAAPNR